MRKLIRYMFLGLFTKENIPNGKVRRAAITATYAAAFYQFRAMYLNSKLEMVAETGKTNPTFRDWLRYQDFNGAADMLDLILEDSTVLLDENEEPFAIAPSTFPIEDTEDQESYWDRQTGGEFSRYGGASIHEEDPQF